MPKTVYYEKATKASTRSRENARGARMAIKEEYNILLVDDEVMVRKLLHNKFFLESRKSFHTPYLPVCSHIVTSL